MLIKIRFSSIVLPDLGERETKIKLNKFEGLILKTKENV